MNSTTTKDTILEIEKQLRNLLSGLATEEVLVDDKEGVEYEAVLCAKIQTQDVLLDTVCKVNKYLGVYFG